MLRDACEAPSGRFECDDPEVYTAQPVWESPTPSASKPFQAIAVLQSVVKERWALRRDA